MADTSRRNALAARASTYSPFQQADDLSRRAAVSRDEGRFSDALKGWQSAAERYQLAITSQRSKPPTILGATTTHDDSGHRRHGRRSNDYDDRPQSCLRDPGPRAAGRSADRCSSGTRRRIRSLDLDALERLYPDLPEYRRRGLETQSAQLPVDGCDLWRRRVDQARADHDRGPYQHQLQLPHPLRTAPKRRGGRRLRHEAHRRPVGHHEHGQCTRGSCLRGFDAHEIPRVRRLES